MSKNNRNVQTTTQAPEDTLLATGQEVTESTVSSQEQTDAQVSGASETTAEPTEQVSQEQTTTQAPMPTTQAPVVETTQPPKKKSVDEDGYDLSIYQNRLDWIEKNGTESEKHVVEVMTNYVKVSMISIDSAILAIEQQRLYRLFEYIHSHPADFAKLYSIVLLFAQTFKKELFNLSMFFRMNQSLTLATDQIANFNNLRTLVLNTINSNNPKQVKNIIDIRKIVDHPSIPEHVRGMYVAYYE